MRKIAFINFGSGEVTDEEENLQLSWHPETPFIRFTMDTKEKPRIVSFLKKKQGMELNAAEHLVPVRQEKKPIRAEVKQDCMKLAQKYLSETAKNAEMTITTETFTREELLYLCCPEMR